MLDPFLIKQSLINYSENCKRKGNLESQLEALESKQYGPSGTGIVKMPEGNQPDRCEVITTRMMSMDNIRKQIQHFNFEIEIAEEMMQSTTGREYDLIQAKYVKRKTSDELNQEFHYSKMQIQRIIDACITRFSISKNITLR